MECTLNKFKDDTKLSDAIHVLEVRMPCSGTWTGMWSTHVNPTNFNQTKCKVFHGLMQSPISTQTGLWMDWRQPQRELGSIGWHCLLVARKANFILGCTKGSVSERLREVVLALCFALMRTHLEYFILLWDPWYERDIDLLEQVQRRATKMIS